MPTLEILDWLIYNAEDMYLPFGPRHETTEYAVETPNLTSIGQVLKDHIGHKALASVLWGREGVVMNNYL